MPGFISVIWDWNCNTEVILACVLYYTPPATRILVRSRSFCCSGTRLRLPRQARGYTGLEDEQQQERRRNKIGSALFRQEDRITNTSTKFNLISLCYESSAFPQALLCYFSLPSCCLLLYDIPFLFLSLSPLSLSFSLSFLISSLSSKLLIS